MCPSVPAAGFASAGMGTPPASALRSESPHVPVSSVTATRRWLAPTVYSGVLYELSVIHGPMPVLISLVISRESAAIRGPEVGSSVAESPRRAFQKLSAAKRRDDDGEPPSASPSFEGTGAAGLGWTPGVGAVGRADEVLLLA